MKPETPIGVLSGVGLEAVKRLGRLGIETVGDLLHHFPRHYDDYSKVTAIREMKPGLVTFRGQVAGIASRRAARRRLSLTEAIISDGTGTIKAIWFNQPYLARSFPVGSSVVVSGKLEFKNNDLALRSPAIEVDKGELKSTARIVPVYSETEGLTSKQLRTWLLPLVKQLGEIEENLPPSVIQSHELITKAAALAEIHFPTGWESLEGARRRLAFEELFFLMLASLSIKQEIQTEPAPAIKFNPDVAKNFVSSLDFQLTDQQRLAAWQILQDMERPLPMNRLLEGDVGSGKTVVAVMAAVMAIESGQQAALMVPTEILARQHAAKIGPLLERLGLSWSLIVGKQPAAVRRSGAEAAKSGQIDLVIGTHALLSSDVGFSKLGLVIIDEQHRFGVNQRQLIKQKAGRLPHLLSLTATPIPRSLALTVYGDLDISIIDQLPPGRKPIQTKVVPAAERASAYGLIDRQIAKGRQVFVVCPLIDPSDKLGARSAAVEAERLREGPFKKRRVDLLHGRLSSDQKQQVMKNFVAGQTDILVATSVIEVGIDVPNASVMMIENADRFGLATLHQLRGRVGRGASQSHCFLLTDSPDEEVLERLAALEATNDGFRLAQVDLERRGPGQIYGQRQHGQLDLRLADLSDTKLLAEVRTAAAAFLQSKDALLKYPQIAERVSRLKAVTSLD